MRLGHYLFGVAIGAVLVVSASGGDVDKMIFGDGVFYRYIAQNLATPKDDLAPFILESGPSYRYARVGLPAAIWVTSAGRRDAMRFAQPALMVASSGAVAAGAATLFPTLGVGALLLPFVALGLTLSIGGGFAEPLAVAFAVWAVVFVERRRWELASLLFACAMLTRETAGLVVLGTIVWMLVHRMRKEALVIGASVVPVLIWHAFVASRYGHLPLLDPYFAKAGGSAIPFRSLWEGLSFSPGSMTIIVIHVVLGAVAVALVRTSLLGAIAAASALQLLWSHQATFQYFGDTVRVFVFLELFLVFALMRRVTQRVAPENLRAS